MLVALSMPSGHRPTGGEAGGRRVGRRLGDHGVVERSESVDLDANAVADLQIPAVGDPDAGGAAGGDHDSGLEGADLGELGDDLGDRRDQLRERLALAQLVVDPGADLERVDVGDLVRGRDPWSDRPVGLEALALPDRRALELPVANGRVVATEEAADGL